MSTAYLVGSSMNTLAAWANSSGGVAGSFGGIPNDTTDVIIDANSPDSYYDIESKILSISILAGYTNTITQTVPVEVDEFSQAGGDFDTDGENFTCNTAFNGTGGTFTGVGSTLLMPYNFVLNGIAFSGSPSLPTIDTASDVEPATVEDAITENAKNPLRVKGDEGEVEMHSLDDQIKAAKFLGSQNQLRSGVQALFSKIKPSGTV